MTDLYILLYVGVVMVHLLGGGYGNVYRFLIPVVPFVFWYGLVAARRLLAWVERAHAANGPTRVFRLATAGYVACYVGLGLGKIVSGAREQHASPFGAYPIKSSNLDAQRLAFWLRDHSRPEERYASTQANLYDVITERTGRDLAVVKADPPDSFLEWIAERRIRYVLVDHTKAHPLQDLLPVIKANPEVFVPVSELPRASLYEVRPRTH